jgi:hypothetical protein
MFTHWHFGEPQPAPVIASYRVQTFQASSLIAHKNDPRDGSKQMAIDNIGQNAFLAHLDRPSSPDFSLTYFCSSIYLQETMQKIF